ncbi:MAG: hypothetical protein AAFM91_14305 [Pseudomonadota bacterium]
MGEQFGKFGLLALFTMGLAAGCGQSDGPDGSDRAPAPPLTSTELFIEFTDDPGPDAERCNPLVRYRLDTPEGLRVSLTYELNGEPSFNTVVLKSATNGGFSGDAPMDGGRGPLGACQDKDVLLTEVICATLDGDRALPCPSMKYDGEAMFASFDISAN